MPYFSDQMTLAEYKAFSSSKGLQGLNALPRNIAPPDVTKPTPQCRAAATALLNGTGSGVLPAGCYDRVARRRPGVTCRSILQRMADGKTALMPLADDSCVNPTKDTVPANELPGAKQPGRDGDAAPRGGTQGESDAGGYTPGDESSGGGYTPRGDSASSSSIPTWAKVLGGVVGVGILGYGFLYGAGKMRNARAARG